MRSADLQKRRSALIERSARLRREFADDAANVSARLSFVDRLRSIQRSGAVRVLIGAGAMLLAFRQPRRLLGVAARIAPFYPWIKPIVARFWRSLSSPP